MNKKLKKAILKLNNKINEASVHDALKLSQAMVNIAHVSRLFKVEK